MQNNNILIAKKTLKELEKKSWKKISFKDLKVNKRISKIKNKTDLLVNINKYFDYLLKNNVSSIENSTSKDMLFEVLMARLDILNNYRSSVKNLINHFISYPYESIKFIPNFIETIIQIATFSNIKINGVAGIPKIKIIFFLYLLILYSWKNDETESLEKTMTNLDKYLTYIEKFVKIS